MKRIGLKVGITVAWYVAIFVVAALPTARKSATLRVAEPSLRPWIEQVIRDDQTLASVDWTIEPGEPAEDAAWLGLARPTHDTQPRARVVAVSTYVVLFWAASLERFGTQPEAAVDWAAIQAAIAEPSGPRFVLPTPGTPTGDDGLLLLALARDGGHTTRLSDESARDARLRTWLEPFYARQNRLRADERIQADDWVRYRSGLGDAGLMPEHTAFELLAVLEPRSSTLLRYPRVNVSRRYALVPPTRGGARSAYERLQSALLTSAAQQGLSSFGYRPVVDTPAPVDGPFITYRSRGADWSARWTHAEPSPAIHELPQAWR